MNKGNELIAKYMGLAYCDKHQYEGWYTNSEFNHRICDKDDLKYHVSMEALLPVLMKIENRKYSFNRDFYFSLGSVIGERYQCYFESSVTNNRKPIYMKGFVADTLVMAVWLAVVDVIDWMIERGMIVL